ncbi:hypothetical protein KHM83_14215 [Fusibacter paucivorans]|uniref:Uncharacterized protein n=1 Tax=Fusibacter paucivorans TaxID=76009 RepID=A0ABS5PRP9_9FIRM|nr:hypothetical protein [Fusibacter paucivorans]MBS7527835.1 hypothetical protein [Fusibacter paucivorans]
MKAFLMDYKVWIVVVLAMITIIIFEWQQFKVLTYQLMLQAKILAKDFILSSGEAQETWVVEKLYAILPHALAALMTKTMLRTVVAYLYHEAKDYLDDGMMNNSI